MYSLRSVALCCMRGTIIAAVLFSFNQVAESQGLAGGRSNNAERYVLKTYEVGDLVFNVPDYPYSAPNNPTNVLSGGMGGLVMNGGYGGPAADASQSTSNKISINDLQQVLVRLVAPKTWTQSAAGIPVAPCNVGLCEASPAVVSGSSPTPYYNEPANPTNSVASSKPQPQGQGELQMLGNTLIVRQTPAVHQEIQQLLDQLREGSGVRKTVAIDARWLVLDSDDLDRLMQVDKKGQRRIDRDALADFTRRPTSIRGLMNCFSGQLVYLVGGTRRNVVSGYIPVVGSLDEPQPSNVQLASLGGGARISYAQLGGGNAPSRSSGVGYQPIVEKPNFGTLLEIRPTLVVKANHAVVDLRSTVTTQGKQIPAPRSGIGNPAVPNIDRFTVETQELATTLSVPLGQPVLVGGLTYVNNTLPSRKTPGKTQTTENRETPQLYLILELR